MNIPQFTAQTSLYRTSNRYRSSALDFGGSSPNQAVVPAQGCMPMAFMGAGVESYQGQRELKLYFFLPPRCNDVVNIMWATPGESWQQLEFEPFNDDFGSCIPYNGNCTYSIGRRINANLGKPYLFAIQSCRTRFLSSSVCGPWSAVAHYLPSGPDTCQDGHEYCGGNCCAAGESCCGDTCCPAGYSCIGGVCTTGFPKTPPPPPPPNNCIFGGAPCGPKCCQPGLECCNYSPEFGADCRKVCVG
jgi:hypothetical protein